MIVPQGPLTRPEQIKVVRQYAQENYDKNGWDIVVEAFDDQEIDQAIGKAKTGWGAIEAVGKIVKTVGAYRLDIQKV